MSPNGTEAFSGKSETDTADELAGHMLFNLSDPVHIAERNTVAATLAGGAATFADIRTMLSPADFRDKFLKACWYEFGAIMDGGGLIDGPALGDALAGYRLKHTSPQDIVESLQGVRVSPKNARHYAEKVAGFSDGRRTSALLSALSDEQKDFEGTPSEFIAEAQRRFLALDRKTGHGGAYLKDIAGPHLATLHAEYDRGNTLRGLTTGMGRTDRVLGGLQPGHLVVIAAGTSVGKSAYASNIAVSAAKLDGAHVRIFSLEMQREEIFGRLAFAEAKINTHKFRDRRMSADDWHEVNTAHERLAGLPIFLNDNAHLTIAELIAECRAARFAGDLDMVILDYAQLITPPAGRRTDTREQEVAAIARSLRVLASELKVPVIVLSQLNEDGKTRESRGLEFEADKLMILSTEAEPSDFQGPLTQEQYDDPDPADYTLLIKKNRGGRRNVKIPLSYVGEYTLFTETEFGRF